MEEQNKLKQGETWDREPERRILQCSKQDFMEAEV